MTENEKIELFDKWYDENYDEWAEGEEGIALREELEQAFKGGVEVLEAENAELKSDNDARKFAMAMSEQVEKQLREENAKLKETVIKMNNVITKTLRDVFFDGVPKPVINHQRKEDWQKGAEFGYNKANEFHYCKDGLPEKEKSVLIYTEIKNVYMAKLVKDDYFITKEGGYVQTSAVIAWKEIVLPELKESE